MYTEFSGETHTANKHLKRQSTSNNAHHLHPNRLTKTRKAAGTWWCGHCVRSTASHLFLMGGDLYNFLGALLKKHLKMHMPFVLAIS